MTHELPHHQSSIGLAPSKWPLRSALISTALLVLAGCGDAGDVAGLKASRSPTLEIRDAVHGAGKRGFYLLPPLVSNPTHTGVFDAALLPTVDICEWSGTSCLVTIASFTTTDGSGGERVRLDESAEHYVVNWDTKACNSGPCELDPAKLYRIAIRASGIELGHADVDVVSNGSALKNVQTGEYVGLVEGRTLPIKFRAETGIIGGVRVNPAAASVVEGATAALSATVIDLHGDVVPGVGVLWSSSSPSVATVDAAGLVTGLLAGTSTVTASVEASSASALVTVTTAGPTGSVVFISNRIPGEGPNVWMMNVDGTDVRRVVVDPGEYHEFPSLSPDKSTVLFGSRYEIWTVKPDGSDRRQVTGFGAVTRAPSWHPDGNRISFYSNRDGTFRIYLMALDGTGLQAVTAGFWSDISTDGRRMVFARETANGVQIFLHEFETGLERQLTNESGVHIEPHWSPDGTKIGYSFQNRVWVLDVDESPLAPRMLSLGPIENSPTWSPDGRYLMFESTRLGGPLAQLWIMKTDGTELRRLLPTHTGGQDSQPSWH